MFHAGIDRFLVQSKSKRLAETQPPPEEVNNLFPGEQRVPLSLRVALVQLYCASFNPHDIVVKYLTGAFTSAERFVPRTRDDGSRISFKKQLPVFAARIVLHLAQENGLAIPPLNGNAGPADGAGTSHEDEDASEPGRQRKRTLDEALATVEECFDTLYDGEAESVEQIPASDADTVVEHTVLSAQMAQGWEPEVWTQEHLRDVQDLATGRKLPSKALQQNLHRCCVRCAWRGPGPGCLCTRA